MEKWSLWAVCRCRWPRYRLTCRWPWFRLTCLGDPDIDLHVGDLDIDLHVGDPDIDLHVGVGACINCSIIISCAHIAGSVVMYIYMASTYS